MALINKLNAIGDAIREKTGKTDLLTLEQMPVEIAAIETGGGGDGGLPEEAFLITGKCTNRFAFGGWDWFIKEYGNKVTTEKITDADTMFNESQIEEIPFDLNFDNSTYRYASSVFKNCKKLKNITGKIKNFYPTNMEELFYNCYMLRELPEFENFNPNRIQTYARSNKDNIFTGCYSLRRIPEEFLKQLWGNYTSYSYSPIYYAFYNCYALDEIRGLNPQSGTITSNMFANTFIGCWRIKDIIFATQEDGTPYTVSWKSQTIDLSPTTSDKQIGFATGGTVDGVWTSPSLKIYNSGITDDKAVIDDISYQALKNDPDWFAGNLKYSRYNHNSAVNTINSLPDTSAYLATAGGTNTIKFCGAAGSHTDGGAINTLTEEEIAVAAAKGWTVTLV